MDSDLASWKGWAELENDPVIFTSIIHSWGVQHIQVNEVIPLEAILERDPSSVIGLIFLSRWVAPEASNETTNCPDGLWFANQISTFSCATIAMMNVINNQNNISLGAELQRFKEATLSKSPKQRGIELDHFQHVKDIHNSFSRQLDRMQVDLRLKDEVQAAARKSRKPRKKTTKRKKKRYDMEDDENGYHFVAYVPAQGHVWRMDGMEQYPRDLGVIEASDNWLLKIITEIQALLEVSEDGGMEFSLLSLIHEPGSSQSAQDASQVVRMKEDWAPFIAQMLKLHAEKGTLEGLLG